jgi:hypothetical protein
VKPSPLDHLPRRKLFGPVHKELVVHTARVRRELNVHTSEPPVTLDSPKPAKLAAARAALTEIGAAIEPSPLVDTTKSRGRPKLDPEAAAAAKEHRRAWNRERMAARRAVAKATQPAASSAL